MIKKNFLFFFFGLLAAFGALVFELLILNIKSILSGIDITQDYFSHLTTFLFIVALTEEFFKYILLQKISIHPSNNNSIFLPVIFFGLGFSFIEMFSFFYSSDHQSSFYALKIFASISLHILTSFILYTFILFKQKNNLLSPILITVIFHFTFNTLIIYNLNYQLIYLYLGLLLVITILLKSKLSHN